MDREIPTFATILRTLTLSEAQLFNGRLRSEGISSHVEHEHTLQTLASNWGGYRVRVRQESLAQARDILSDLQRGDLALADEDGDAKHEVIAFLPEKPLWNPDVAAALSFLFTPVFGAIVHAVNWSRLHNERRARNGCVWAACMAAAMIATVGVAHPTARNSQITTGMLAFVSFWCLVFWYFGSARTQSRLILSDLRGQYRRASWFTPIWAAVIVGSFLFPFLPVGRSIVSLSLGGR